MSNFIFLEDMQKAFQRICESQHDVGLAGSQYERICEAADEEEAAKKQMVEKCQKLLSDKRMGKAKKFLECALAAIDELTPEQAGKIEQLYTLCFNESEDEDEEEIDEAEEEETLDPDVEVMKSSFINDYKADKMSIYKMLEGWKAFGEWILIHGKNEERPIMKAMLAVISDEYLPKFAEVPGATEDSDKEHAADTDDKGEQTDDEPEETEEEEVEVEVDDEEPAEEDEEEDAEESEEDDAEEVDESEEEPEEKKPVTEDANDSELTWLIFNAATIRNKFKVTWDISEDFQQLTATCKDKSEATKLKKIFEEEVKLWKQLEQDDTANAEQTVASQIKKIDVEDNKVIITLP